MDLPKDKVTQSLQQFKERRDSLLHDDERFDHHLHRFVDFCKNNPLVQSVLRPLESKYDLNAREWWEEARAGVERWITRLPLPEDRSEELVLEWRLPLLADTDDSWVFRFGSMFGKSKLAEWVNTFLVLVARPFADEMSRRLAEAANMASPEARDLQAVPLNRIPSEKESRIFLSHKTVDNPLVYRYYHALKELGFDPWLDEQAMPAGANLERGILEGFHESCAAIFFITENFRDESYLATEVDYAVIEKRKKGSKFAIITLRYSDAAEVPGLLIPYIYRTVSNDLEGFHELIRALPIELGPVRWKEAVVD